MGPGPQGEHDVALAPMAIFAAGLGSDNAQCGAVAFGYRQTRESADNRLKLIVIGRPVHGEGDD